MQSHTIRNWLVWVGMWLVGACVTPLAGAQLAAGSRGANSGDATAENSEQVPTLGGRSMPRFSDQGWRRVLPSPFGESSEILSEDEIAEAENENLYVHFAEFINATTGQKVRDSLPIRAPRTLGQRLPERYVVGPGDEIEVQVWGSVNGQYKLTVDSTGRVFVPEVGSIQLQGVQNAELANVISGHLKRLYKGFEVRALVSSARSIEVQVAGNARHVGVHTVPATMGLLGAVLSFSKPSGQGSRRFVELRRRGGSRQRVDLYCFFNDNCSQLPSQLLDGDVLFVPPRARLAAVTGPVGRAGIYELIEGETIDDLIRYAGGLSSVADAEQVHLHTFAQQGISTRKFRSTRLQEFCRPAKAGGDCIDLNDGDYVEVQTKLPFVSGVVSLVAQGAEPQRIQFRPGMRILDLINGPLTRLIPTLAMNAVNSPQFTSASRLDETIIRLDLESVSVFRFDPGTREYRAFRVDVRAAQTAGPQSAADAELADGDIVVVEEQAAWKTPRDSLIYTVRILGEVHRPGRFRFEGKKTLQQALAESGGLTDRAATWSTVVLRVSDVRSAVSKDMLDRAIAAIREQQGRQERANTGSATGTSSVAGLDARGGLVRRGTTSLTQRTMADLKQLLADREMIFVSNADSGLSGNLELAPNDIVLVPPKQNTVACYGAFFHTGEIILQGDVIKYKDARNRCGVIEDLNPTLYHISAREGRTCREGMFTSCPDAQGGDVLIALPGAVGKSGFAAYAEMIDLIYKTAVSAATLKLLF